MNDTSRITIAYGEGVGPEIMNAVLTICQKAEVGFALDIIQLGDEYYRGDYMNGIAPQSWQILHRNKILLKGPTVTPSHKGKQSLEISLKHILGTTISLRHLKSYAPVVHTGFPGMDVVVISGNAEGSYSTMEYRKSSDFYQNLQVISRAGTTQLLRYAFEYATRYNRKKVTCVGKSDVVAFSEGMIRDVFKSIAKDYNVEACYETIDGCMSYILMQPEQYDVIVTTDIYGDIIANTAARLTRCNELASAMHMGENGYAIFEPAHSALVSIEDQGISNPSGLLNAVIMLLLYIGKKDKATLIHNAWLKTIEDGIHTPEFYYEGISKQVVGLHEFTDAIVERLGSSPTIIEAVDYTDYEVLWPEPQKPTPKSEKTLVGVDIFAEWREKDILAFVGKVQGLVQDLQLKLQMVDCKGVKIWPGEHPAVVINDVWRLRFVPAGHKIATHKMVQELLGQLENNWFEIVKVEHLYVYNGKLGFTLPIGE